MVYKISQELIKAIADYLSQRPYAEVVGLFNALMKLEVIQEKKNETKKK